MHSSGSWELQIDPSVFKALRRIPKRDTEALLAAIRLLPVDPYFGDIKKMRGEQDVWRRRIGAYRIFYKVKGAERIVLVFRAERRTSQTY